MPGFTGLVERQATPDAAPVQTGRKPESAERAPSVSAPNSRGATRKAAARPAPEAGAPQFPFIAIPVPVPESIPPQPVSVPLEAARTSPPVDTHPLDDVPLQAPHEDAALQVTIHMPKDSVEAAPVRPEPLLRVAPEAAITPIPAVAAPVAPPAAAVAPEHRSAVSTLPPANLKEASPAAPAEPAPHEPPPRQIKSVSLEFAPDGAGDVRLRVTERAGEVHISLHSADPSLSGKLHEGVQDLVGSLSQAGYEAEAWTRGQGHQGSRRDPEDPKQHPPAPEDSGTEEFGAIFDQPTEEVS
jgi:hypothetical protein